MTTMERKHIVFLIASLFVVHSNSQLPSIVEDVGSTSTTSEIQKKNSESTTSDAGLQSAAINLQVHDAPSAMGIVGDSGATNIQDALTFPDLPAFPSSFPAELPPAVSSVPISGNSKQTNTEPLQNEISQLASELGLDLNLFGSAVEQSKVDSQQPAKSDTSAQGGEGLGLPSVSVPKESTNADQTALPALNAITPDAKPSVDILPINGPLPSIELPVVSGAIPNSISPFPSFDGKMDPPQEMSNVPEVFAVPVGLDAMSTNNIDGGLPQIDNSISALPSGISDSLPSSDNAASASSVLPGALPLAPLPSDNAASSSSFSDLFANAPSPSDNAASSSSSFAGMFAKAPLPTDNAASSSALPGALPLTPLPSDNAASSSSSFSDLFANAPSPSDNADSAPSSFADMFANAPLPTDNVASASPIPGDMFAGPALPSGAPLPSLPLGSSASALPGSMFPGGPLPSENGPLPIGGALPGAPLPLIPQNAAPLPGSLPSLTTQNQETKPENQGTPSQQNPSPFPFLFGIPPGMVRLDSTPADNNAIGGTPQQNSNTQQSGTANQIPPANQIPGAMPNNPFGMFPGMMGAPGFGLPGQVQQGQNPSGLNPLNPVRSNGLPATSSSVQTLPGGLPSLPSAGGQSNTPSVPESSQNNNQALPGQMPFDPRMAGMFPQFMPGMMPGRPGFPQGLPNAQGQQNVPGAPQGGAFPNLPSLGSQPNNSNQALPRQLPFDPRIAGMFPQFMPGMPMPGRPGFPQGLPNTRGQQNVPSVPQGGAVPNLPPAGGSQNTSAQGLPRQLPFDPRMAGLLPPFMRGMPMPGGRMPGFPPGFLGRRPPQSPQGLPGAPQNVRGLPGAPQNLPGLPGAPQNPPGLPGAPLTGDQADATLLPRAEQVLRQVQDLVDNLRSSNNQQGAAGQVPSAGPQGTCPSGRPRVRCNTNPCEEVTCLNVLNARCRPACDECAPHFYVIDRSSSGSTERDVSGICLTVNWASPNSRRESQTPSRPAAPARQPGLAQSLEESALRLGPDGRLLLVSPSEAGGMPVPGIQGIRRLPTSRDVLPAGIGRRPPFDPRILEQLQRANPGIAEALMSGQVSPAILFDPRLRRLAQERTAPSDMAVMRRPGATPDIGDLLRREQERRLQRIPGLARMQGALQAAGRLPASRLQTASDQPAINNSNAPGTARNELAQAFRQFMRQVPRRAL